MQQKTEQEEIIVRYLLGDLSEDEQNRIEEQLFTDGKFFEQMLSVEDSLIDDFLSGKLAAEERARVETLLTSSPYQLRHLAFTKELLAELTEKAAAKDKEPAVVHPKDQSWWQAFLVSLRQASGLRQLSLVTWALVPAVIIGLLIWNLLLQRKIVTLEVERTAVESQRQEFEKQVDAFNQRSEELSNQLAREQEETARLAAETAAAELERRKLKEQVNSLNQKSKRLGNQLARERSKSHESESKLSGITPLPVEGRSAVNLLDLPVDSTLRSAGGRPVEIRIKPEAESLGININLDGSDDFTSYRVTIKSLDGRPIWGSSVVPASQVESRKINVLVPASTFENKTYRLTLEGDSGAGKFDVIRDYVFRIRR